MLYTENVITYTVPGATQAFVSKAWQHCRPLIGHLGLPQLCLQLLPCAVRGFLRTSLVSRQLLQALPQHVHLLQLLPELGADLQTGPCRLEGLLSAAVAFLEHKLCSRVVLR